jgi:hypothetical protein
MSRGDTQSPDFNSLEQDKFTKSNIPLNESIKN